MISADINDFSYVNDNFSYEAGNNMLIEYAEVLKRQDIFLLTCRIYSDYFYCFVYSHDITRDELLTKLKDINYEFDSTQKKNYPAGSICICAGVYFLESNAVNSTICMDNSNLARRSIRVISSINWLYIIRKCTLNVAEKRLSVLNLTPL